MRVVALISGGKDSCYNMMQCVQNGHQIVALANLRPPDKDELDSYMFQTVGHHALELYAEAMGLPMFRRTITGSSVEIGKDYVKNDGDEVEDLYQLLVSVKSEIEFDAVSSGAILSDYQRVRVEHVCSRLGVSSLAYLWRRDQEELYTEMISNGLVAVIIKVAAMGLEPRKHLGLKMVELQPHLLKLNSQFGLNVCGEGGEYETLTLDCPLFQKRIIIDDFQIVIHSDDAFAQVGYLHLKSMHLEQKPQESTRMAELAVQYTGDTLDNIPGHVHVHKENTQFERNITICLPEKQITNKDKVQSNDTGSYLWITGLNGYKQEGLTVEEITKAVMDKLNDQISRYSSCMGDAILMHLFVKNMSDFSKVNSIYQTYFPINPPARACLEADLENDCLLHLDCLLYRPGEDERESSGEHINGTRRHTREAMHVQSISHWASANIGPYSQAVKVDPLMFVSGNIGLWPATMTIIEGGITVQSALSLRHVDRIVTAFEPMESLLNAVYGFCYVTRNEDIGTAEQALKMAIHAKMQSNNSVLEESHVGCLMSYIVVPCLPKGALIEWQVMTHNAPDRWKGFSSFVDCEEVLLDFQSVYYSTENTCGVVNCHIVPTMCASTINLQDVLSKYVQEFQTLCLRHGFSFKDLLTMRIFYVKSLVTRGNENELRACVDIALGDCVIVPAFTTLPVRGLKGAAIMAVSCWFQC